MAVEATLVERTSSSSASSASSSSSSSSSSVAKKKSKKTKKKEEPPVILDDDGRALGSNEALAFGALAGWYFHFLPYIYYFWCNQKKTPRRFLLGVHFGYCVTCVFNIVVTIATSVILSFIDFDLCPPAGCEGFDWETLRQVGFVLSMVALGYYIIMSIVTAVLAVREFASHKYFHRVGPVSAHYNPTTDNSHHNYSHDHNDANASAAPTMA